MAASVNVFLEYFFPGLGALFALLLLRLCLGPRLNHAKRTVLLLHVLYLSAMFNVVGLPGLPYVGWEANVNLVPFSDVSDRRYVWLSGMNALMFLPLGFFLPLLWRRFQNFREVLLAGFGTSLAIELLQLFSFRATDVDDLIYNTLGACLGFAIAKLLFGKRFRPGIRSSRSDLISFWFISGVVFFFQFFLRYPVLTALAGVEMT